MSGPRFFALLSCMFLFYCENNYGQCCTGFMNSNVFSGTGAGSGITTGSFNSFFGVSSGSANTSGGYNNFLGYAAGYSNTIGGYNNFIGSLSGYSTTEGLYNNFLGHEAGYSNTTGSRNNFIGYQSGYNNTVGEYNTFLGNTAGLRNTEGSYNTFLGRGAGQINITGSSNSFVGSSSGAFNSTGKQNTFLGNASGQDNETGSFNTFVGRLAGYQNVTGYGNVALGAGAGPPAQNTALSMRLYIDVDTFFTGNPDPLIYGEFDNNLVRINGTFEATGGVGNSSSMEIKENFRAISTAEILNQLSRLTISEWNYKNQPGIIHIGPVSEEFNRLFGFNGNDKIIYTVDADGINMAAIQALKKENDQLKDLLNELNHRISSLERFIESQEKN